MRFTMIALYWKIVFKVFLCVPNIDATERCESTIGYWLLSGHGKIEIEMQLGLSDDYICINYDITVKNQANLV